MTSFLLVDVMLKVLRCKGREGRATGALKTLICLATVIIGGARRSCKPGRRRVVFQGFLHKTRLKDCVLVEPCCAAMCRVADVFSPMYSSMYKMMSNRHLQPVIGNVELYYVDHPFRPCTKSVTRYTE